ncbi:hypothetical protein [Rhodanobacter sp. OR92]|uniref:hypothetical protein n=1 Tax=Rhodanobacter sp. OR92 TaxID=1076524 RepID=UPI0004287423|nr:hypothetical protein [Rhodanobacter sp. OR92]
MRALLLIAVLLTLAACKPAVKPDLPGADKIVTPTIVTVERFVYVRVKPYLTKPEPVAEGPIAQCFDVAAKRRAALQRANAKLTQISTIQGTEVQP